MKSSEDRLAEIKKMHEEGVRLNRKDRRTLEKAKRSGFDTTLPVPEADKRVRQRLDSGATVAP